jgi:hypothetical protein
VARACPATLATLGHQATVALERPVTLGNRVGPVGPAIAVLVVTPAFPAGPVIVVTQVLPVTLVKAV